MFRTSPVVRTRKTRLAVAAVLAGAVAAIVAVAVGSAAPAAGPTITKQPFGSTSEGPVDLYTLTNSHQMEVKIMTYGGIIQSVKVPDRSGHVANVVLGFDNL